MSGKPVTYDHLKSEKKPVHKHVWISLDSELSDDVQRLADREQALRIRVAVREDDLDIKQEYVDVQAELEEKQALLREVSVKFTFKSLSPRRFDELLNEHAPEPKHIKRAKELGGANASVEYHPETFPPALVAACIVEPELTKAEVNSLWEDGNWNTAELASLFQCAIEANQERSTPNLGNGSRGTNGSGKN